jgi:hypothetical protein
MLRFALSHSAALRPAQTAGVEIKPAVWAGHEPLMLTIIGICLSTSFSE